VGGRAINVLLNGDVGLNERLGPRHRAWIAAAVNTVGFNQILLV